ncbi:putative lipoprotein [Pseudomonas amygdali pv. dendropanacis]|uniref:Putative lipoprotein n=1 Tax=Pseudomonas amygdali pv. dendropanacis TaxID=235272 RepID=A0A0P9SBW5_PSEA0|nr:putative lipoprotein [Pseudomonas amygdali pv. dendropanacis]
MYKMIAALTFLAITSATLTGCKDKEGSTGNAAATKTTYYSSYKCNIDSIAGKSSPGTGASIYVPRGVAMFNGSVITANQDAPKEIRLRLTGYKGKPTTFKDPPSLIELTW